MTRIDDEPGLHPLAPNDTFLGELQRGRGRAYLRALELPAAEVNEQLLDCVVRDPREDRQVDSRDDLYAEIALRSGFDLVPVEARVRRFSEGAEWRSRMALDVIQALAKRRHARSVAFLREYVEWGSSRWDAVDTLETALGVEGCRDLGERLCARLDDEELESELGGLLAKRELLAGWSARNTRIARLVEDLRARAADRERAERAASAFFDQLELEDALFRLGGRASACDASSLTRSIERRAQAGDIALLRSSLHPHRPARHLAAMLALSHIATPEAHDAILEGARRLGELRRAAVRATEIALLSLPSERTLPVARAWLERTSHPYRRVALEILSSRATETDLQRILALLEPAGADELHVDADPALRALRRFPGRGWLPGVEHAFVELRCSNCRNEAAQTLAVLDRERFARTYARECLWDCHEGTIQLGIELAPLDEPLVRERLEELARGPAWFDADTAEAARTRLSSGR